MISRDSSEFQEVINRERIHERERFDILVNQMQERYKCGSNVHDFTMMKVMLQQSLLEYL